jgi:hypothetical protein
MYLRQPYGQFAHDDYVGALVRNSITSDDMSKLFAQQKLDTEMIMNTYARTTNGLISALELSVNQSTTKQAINDSFTYMDLTGSYVPVTDVKHSSGFGWIELS